MPITTLPNPGMDFTPLTPLTAEEMDDIVENIEAINNATIQTGSIANGAVTKAKLGADALSNFSYSTSEIDTGTTWIDGKKIYKKTFTKTTAISSSNSTSSYQIALGVENIDTIVNFEAITKRETNTTALEDYTAALEFHYGDSQYRTLSILVSGNISVEWSLFGFNGSTLYDYITIYYTKSS